MPFSFFGLILHCFILRTKSLTPFLSCSSGSVDTDIVGGVTLRRRKGCRLGSEMMHKRWGWGIIFICLVLTVTGCAAVEVYSSNPAVQKMGNDYFNVELEPQLQEGQNFFTSFRFVFTNTTKKDLHVDWEKTHYLFDGRRAGRFLWEGVDWDALKKVRNQPLIPVAAGDTVTATIFPLSLAGRSRLTSTTGLRYTRGPLPVGENGIFLVVRHDGKEIREKIVVDIEAQPG